MPGFGPFGDGPVASVSTGGGDIFDGTLADTLTMSLVDVAVKQRPATAAVTVSIGNVEEISAARAFLRVLVDTATLTGTATTLMGVLIRDTVIATALAQGKATYQISVAQNAAFQTLLNVGVPAAVAESVITNATATGERVVRVLEQLQITSVLLSPAQYKKSVTETLRMLDALSRFLSGAVIEGIQTTEAWAAVKHSPGVLADTIGMSSPVQPLWLLRVVAQDSVTVTAAEAVRMLFKPVIGEEIELTGGYVAPDGSFTTWAMNTRTGAVTEYQNYAFNSFARIGDRYIGASANGLYELLGDNDDGASISTRITGGFMQFGGTKLSRLKAAYIATRGEGNFVLKIETGDGVIYNYAVSTRDMRSTKVHMGKGQRARYFAFELSSTDGHDFDLDTLEFVPIVMQRRV